MTCLLTLSTWELLNKTNQGKNRMRTQCCARISTNVQYRQLVLPGKAFTSFQRRFRDSSKWDTSGHPRSKVCPIAFGHTPSYTIVLRSNRIRYKRRLAPLRNLTCDSSGITIEHLVVLESKESQWRLKWVERKNQGKSSNKLRGCKAVLFADATGCVARDTNEVASK